MNKIRLSEAGMPLELGRFSCTVAAFLLVMVSLQLQAQQAFPVFPSLAGEELIGRVVDFYKPRTVLEYGDARDVLYGTIYNEQDTVKCVYSGHSIYLPKNTDPSTFLFMSGTSNGINCEHTFPRSKGADEDNGNSFSDMHHLFPVQTSVNTARSNLAFGEIDDPRSTSWYFLTQVTNRIPSANIDSYSEKSGSRFEPREDHKGNTARAMFYFFTMYKNDALAADPAFFEQQREDLCHWHTLDPVDSIELARTHMIGSYQNRLPNPFVLEASLALRAYCGADVSEVNQADEALTSVYPNPVVDQLQIVAKGANEVQLLDVLGRTVLTSVFSEATEVDLSSLRSGTYYVLVGEEVFKVVKL